MIQNILFVEYDFQNRAEYCKLLRKSGYQVTEARDGTEALALLEDRIFDLVISNFLLPKLHGLDLVEVIHARWSKIPIIVISGYISASAATHILGGYAKFIQTPINHEVLLAAIQDLSTAKPVRH